MLLSAPCACKWICVNIMIIPYRENHQSQVRLHTPHQNQFLLAPEYAKDITKLYDVYYMVVRICCPQTVL